MSVALFIKLSKDVDFDIFVNGKALSHTADVLDGFASQLGVKPLMEFYSTDPEDLPEELEGIEITWKEKWFLPEDGLATVNALLSHLATNDVLGDDKDRVLADLKEFELVLSEAKKQELKWHLEVDY